MRNNTHQRFELGKIIISSQTQEYTHPQDVLKALLRHSRGDWGELDAIWRKRNDQALTGDPAGEVISEYRDRYDRYFFVVTNAARFETRVALRHELNWSSDW